MNQKTAKSLRRQLRTVGIDFRERKYAPQETYTVKATLLPFLPPLEFQVTKPLRLAMCGRLYYHSMKRTVRA